MHVCMYNPEKTRIGALKQKYVVAMATSVIVNLYRCSSRRERKNVYKDLHGDSLGLVASTRERYRGRRCLNSSSAEL